MVAVPPFKAVSISTHAPAQGATISVASAWYFLFDFNPRSRTGSDTAIPFPHGFPFYFNPRSRTGSDISSIVFFLIFAISTHAPAQGATHTFFFLPPGEAFQPTLPHRERRRWQMPVPRQNKYFNPRSRTGSDPQRPQGSHYSSAFQPTLPHRERLG